MNVKFIHKIISTLNVIEWEIKRTTNLLLRLFILQKIVIESPY